MGLDANKINERFEQPRCEFMFYFLDYGLRAETFLTTKEHREKSH